MRFSVDSLHSANLRLYRPEALAVYEELFLYACPKFISANGPPYDDAQALAAVFQSIANDETAPRRIDPTHRHLNLFLNDVQAHAPVPKLKSFLRLYTSLGSSKLAGFYGEDEETMIQEMMAMKQASRTLTRVAPAASNEKGSLLDGTTISTSDLNFVIDEVSLLPPFIVSDLMEMRLFSRWCTSQNLPLEGVMVDGT